MITKFFLYLIMSKLHICSVEYITQSVSTWSMVTVINSWYLIQNIIKLDIQVYFYCSNLFILYFTHLISNYHFLFIRVFLKLFQIHWPNYDLEYCLFEYWQYEYCEFREKCLGGNVCVRSLNWHGERITCFDFTVHWVSHLNKKICIGMNRLSG